MKTVGILTFHASHNYGSVLQAYALSKQLEFIGFKAEIINLRNQAQKDAYRVFQTKGSGVKKVVHTLFALYNLPASRRRANNFEKFINIDLPVTDRCFSKGEELIGATDYDIYLCGSDQVWNPACQDFESAYYLDFVSNGAKRISYAPSLGKLKFSDEQKKLISELILNIDNISCRESDGAELLRHLTTKQVTEVCDPVILYGRERWHEFGQPPKETSPYILTYFLENNHGTKKYLTELQRMTGYNVICLNEDIHDIGKHYTHVIDASPQEFVGYFEHASLIYTNSFHGTAFASIFQKPFLTIIGAEHEENNNDSRKINYLQGIGLENRIVFDCIPDIDKILSTDDIIQSSANMERIRKLSLNYLETALGEC